MRVRVFPKTLRVEIENETRVFPESLIFETKMRASHLIADMVQLLSKLLIHLGRISKESPAESLPHRIQKSNLVSSQFNSNNLVLASKYPVKIQPQSGFFSFVFSLKYC